MESLTYQNWLKKRAGRHILACSIGSVLSLLAGLVVLFLTFWFAYFVVYLGEGGVSAVTELCFNHRFHLGHAWRLVICGFFIVALFVEWIRRSPWDLGNYGKVVSPPGAKALARRDGTVALGLLLANPQASASIIAEILYTGPRLVLGAGSLVRSGLQTRNLDTPACAQILELLAASEKPVTYEELQSAQPEVEWIRTGASMTWIPGIIILEKGLSTTNDLREELVQLTTDSRD